ncbi:MAG: hypothetical protein EOP34_09675 [Rickettsiales bacterium]|nr:MAG: hypothetical protein EOP34_09675 [Rickettsiales bacterium]
MIISYISNKKTSETSLDDRILQNNLLNKDKWNRYEHFLDFIQSFLLHYSNIFITIQIIYQDILEIVCTLRIVWEEEMGCKR